MIYSDLHRAEYSTLVTLAAEEGGAVTGDRAGVNKVIRISC